jgi:hypothetical protein
MFIAFLYMFRGTMCPSSGENTVPMRHLVLGICHIGVKKNNNNKKKGKAVPLQAWNGRVPGN